jgi:hypothetical protein
VTVFVDGYTANVGGAYVLTVTDISACADGFVERRACLDGNGVEQRFCAQGTWGPFSACLCDPGGAFTRACGLNGRGEQDFVCAGGQFPDDPPCVDPDECVDGDEEGLACLAGTGVQARTCVAGEWQLGPCAGAVCPPATVAVIGVQGGTLVAGTSQLAGSCGQSNISTEATYRFTAGAAGNYTFDTTGSAFDTVLHLRRVCGDAQSQIACDDDSGEGSASRITTALGAGEQIIVVVDGYNGRVGDYQLTIAAGNIAVCTEEASEPNDSVDDAELLIDDFFDGLAASGAICGGNTDFYAVAADANCVVTAEVEVTAGEIPEVTLYSPDAQPVASVVVPPLVVTGSFAQAGEWYIEVAPVVGQATYNVEVDGRVPLTLSQQAWSRESFTAEADGSQAQASPREEGAHGGVGFGAALRGRAGGEAFVVGDEGVALFDGAKLHAPADLGADVDIGGAEAIAEQVGTRLEGAFERVDGVFVGAISHHAGLAIGALERAIGDGLLDATGGKKEPAQIGAAGGVVERGGEAGFGDGIGEVGTDGSALGDDDAAVHDGRQLAHRVDREELGCLVLTFAEVDQLGLVGRAGLFDHPVRDLAA